MTAIHNDTPASLQLTDLSNAQLWDKLTELANANLVHYFIPPQMLNFDGMTVARLTQDGMTLAGLDECLIILNKTFNDPFWTNAKTKEKLARAIAHTSLKDTADTKILGDFVVKLDEFLHHASQLTHYFNKMFEVIKMQNKQLADLQKDIAELDRFSQLLSGFIEKNKNHSHIFNLETHFTLISTSYSASLINYQQAKIAYEQLVEKSHTIIGCVNALHAFKLLIAQFAQNHSLENLQRVMDWLIQHNFARELK